MRYKSLRQEGLREDDKRIDKEVEILEEPKDAKVDNKANRQKNLGRPSFPPSQLKKPYDVRPCAGKGNESQETPVPPAVEHIAGNDKPEVLQSQIPVQGPEHDPDRRQEKHELERIEYHRIMVSGLPPLPSSSRGRIAHAKPD